VQIQAIIITIKNLNKYYKDFKPFYFGLTASRTAMRSTAKQLEMCDILMET